MTPIWKGRARPLAPEDFDATAAMLDPRINPATLRAIWQVESAGRSYRADGTVERRFEPHRMPQAKTNWRDSLKLSTAKREAAFAVAYSRSPEDALRATSWGGPQIMGDNHAAAGFPSAKAMVAAFADHEAAQLEAFAALVKAWGLVPALVAKDWLTFARRYNGSGQPEVYARKMEAAYRKLTGTATPSVLRVGDRGEAVERLQSALGVPVDGAFGPGTRAALLAFQRDNGLAADGVAGAETWRVLRERRGAKPVAQATTGDVLVKKVEKVSAVAGVAATSLGAVRSALPEDVFTILTYGGLGLAGVYLVATVIRRARG